jgi:hypothetical protein
MYVHVAVTGDILNALRRHELAFVTHPFAHLSEKQTLVY